MTQPLPAIALLLVLSFAAWSVWLVLADAALALLARGFNQNDGDMK